MRAKQGQTAKTHARNSKARNRASAHRAKVATKTAPLGKVVHLAKASARLGKVVTKTVARAAPVGQATARLAKTAPTALTVAQVARLYLARAKTLGRVPKGLPSKTTFLVVVGGGALVAAPNTAEAGAMSTLSATSRRVPVRKQMLSCCACLSLSRRTTWPL